MIPSCAFGGRIAQAVESGWQQAIGKVIQPTKVRASMIQLVGFGVLLYSVWIHSGIYMMAALSLVLIAHKSCTMKQLWEFDSKN